MTNMPSKEDPSEGIRNSVSSSHSASSIDVTFEDQDCDPSGDVFVWGEVVCCTFMNDVGKASSSGAKVDVLLPKPLVSNILLDVHHVACGGQHAALVTKQGEIFTWGEEAGGHLVLGVDISQPRLVGSLAMTSFHFAACGEFHTCAITNTGELYTWGDGNYNVGLLGHGTEASHCKPKRVLGPLEGLRVVYVSCGIWHTALITLTGQLFTFGDGSFGVLGHGDRHSIAYPRMVESLADFKTIAVACGVWHTAALVEVISTKSGVSASLGKLFTWGDGDNYRLGHGDKETRLKPTCVPSLNDYSFWKVACGHNLTVGLTTSGCVFTMGSAAYGQLGKPSCEGKLPTNVQGKLVGEFVEEVACGSYHVTVLTAKNHVYTWGKGANGRLGHGDTDDRITPTLVEALKDRPVKHIACGSKFTAAICHHRWVSSSEQVHCSGCRHAFGFTRKRHHCYHCGLVFCHSCSSKKALRAALSPNPAKPHRVCDPCHMILNRVDSYSGFSGRTSLLRSPGESKEKHEKMDTTSILSDKSSNLDLSENQDVKYAKQGNTYESSSLSGESRVFSLLHMKDIFTDKSLNSRLSRVSTVSDSPKGNSAVHVDPAAAISDSSCSNDLDDVLLEENKNLSQEKEKLSVQIANLNHYCKVQEDELQKLEVKTKKAIALAAEELEKSKVVKDMMKCLILQLKSMNDKLPTGLYAGNEARLESLPTGEESVTILQSGLHPLVKCGAPKFDVPDEIHAYTLPMKRKIIEKLNLNGKDVELISEAHSQCSVDAVSPEHGKLDNPTQTSKYNGRACFGNLQVLSEWIEQYEPGVYITLVLFQDGNRDLKRVRFSRRRFGEHQAACWWSENREKVYEKYNIFPSGKSSVSTSNSEHVSSKFTLSPSPKHSPTKPICSS